MGWVVTKEVFRAYLYKAENCIRCIGLKCLRCNGAVKGSIWLRVYFCPKCMCLYPRSWLVGKRS